MTQDEARERAEIMLAYANGSEVQYWHGGNGKWDDVHGEPSFNRSDTYRVKPRAKLRPWTPQEAIGKVVVEKGGVIASMIVRVRTDHDICHIHGTGDVSSARQLLRDYIQLDGSPCGVVVEEDEK